jgi:fatty-acyl-CoA synthase
VSVRIIEKNPSAFSRPWLIKNLIKPALTHAPEQEIVDRNKLRYSYRPFSPV